jgi:hypothetical protein
MIYETVYLPGLTMITSYSRGGRSFQVYSARLRDNMTVCHSHDGKVLVISYTEKAVHRHYHLLVTTDGPIDDDWEYVGSFDSEIHGEYRHLFLRAA